MTEPRRKIGSNALGPHKMKRGRPARASKAVSVGSGQRGKRQVSGRFDFGDGLRGAPDPLPGRRTRITLSVDTEVLDWFRRGAQTMGGGNYALMMSEALRRHATERPESLEDILRGVLREELSLLRVARRRRPGD